MQSMTLLEGTAVYDSERYGYRRDDYSAREYTLSTLQTLHCKATMYGNAVRGFTQCCL